MEDNMKRFMFFLLLSLLTGCSLLQQTTENNFAPQLLIQSPLPVVTQAIARPNLKIEMDLFILKDGSVGKVKLVNGSGDKVWDSLAVETILKWKYSPAQVDHHSVNIWLHQIAIVEYMDPKYLVLAEIICPTVEEADSIYAALENGKNFDDLAAFQSALPDHEKNGDLGNVDIRLYPEHIRSELSYLEKDQYTKPLKYGYKYVIFKRK
jgi:TonB family protein